MQQQVYQQEEHGISVEDIDRDALYCLEKLRSAGYIAYLVGGSVRDLLLKKKPKDFDISTSALPEEIKKLFRNSILIGKRFRLAHIRFGRKILEVSTFRSGDVGAEVLIVRDNEWGTEQQDVVRRDFTINGLFYDAATQTVIDYVGGYLDIQKQMLRTIGQPYVRFKQDPVRMIRLLKFQARFGFLIDPPAKIALLDCRHEILKSAPARILEEVLRMLEIGSARIFFHLLNEHGFLELLMPGLVRAFETSDGDEIYSLLEEVDLIVNAPPMVPPHRAVLLSCLLFPLLQRHLKDRFLDRNILPHLGNIQDEAHDLVDGVFNPFLHLPKRLRATVISTLTSQYRLTPLEQKKRRRLRIPNDPDFSLALEFLTLRSRLEPGLSIVLNEWEKAVNGKAPTVPRKRRRKRSEHSPPSE